MRRDRHRPGSGEHTVGAVTEAVVAATEAVETMVTPVAVRRWTRPDSYRVLIAVLILIAGGLIAARGVPAWEDDLFEAINHAPGWMYPMAWLVMQLGNLWVATAVAVVAGLALRRRRTTVVFALTPLVAWLAAIAVKNSVGRGRPAGLGLVVTGHGATETGLGFVSGHTMVAFALATVLAPHLRRHLRLPAFALAAVVGLTRIYVGVHMPLDIIGGAAGGLLVGELARVIETRWSRWSRLSPSERV